MDKHKEKQRQGCVQRAVQHIRRNRCGTASLLLLAVGAVTFLLVQSGGVGWLTDAPILQPGRVLLVTAHPDDEVIFFSSSVTALHAAGAEVFLLCLTSGAPALPIIIFIPVLRGRGCRAVPRVSFCPVVADDRPQVWRRSAVFLRLSCFNK